MADNEERELITSRGNEWEVVSLTASAYAAAPGPKQVELNDDDKEKPDGEDNGETSQAMFLSRHFDFPPNQPENMPLEPENIEICNEQSGDNASLELVAEEGGGSDFKDDGNWNTKCLTDDFMRIQLFDEKGDKLSISGTKFDEGMALERLDLADKEQSIFNTMEFSTLNSEATMGGSTTVGDNRVVTEPIEPSDEGLDSYLPHLQKPVDKDKDDGSELPCEGWWKRRAASLYTHAKETNAVWSIFIAAAVMGLVILGQRWHQEKRKDLQLKWEFGINDQKTGRMVGPLYRFKDVIVGGTQRGSFISGIASTEL
ncbi:hypothetical protein LguiB_026171 [Lonicera macranthoides]